jgi:hypothetical protein
MSRRAGQFAIVPGTVASTVAPTKPKKTDGYRLVDLAGPRPHVLGGGSLETMPIHVSIIP